MTNSVGVLANCKYVQMPDRHVSPPLSLYKITGMIDERLFCEVFPVTEEVTAGKAATYGQITSVIFCRGISFVLFLISIISGTSLMGWPLIFQNIIATHFSIMMIVFVIARIYNESRTKQEGRQLYEKRYSRQKNF